MFLSQPCGANKDNKDLGAVSKRYRNMHEVVYIDLAQ